MARSKSRILILGTAFVALGIGYVMQYGADLPGASVQDVVVTDLQVTGITDASSASVVAMPRSPDIAIALPETPVSIALAEEPAFEAIGPLPEDTTEAPTFACDVSLETELAPAAQVLVTVFAPCMKNERMTLHHNGLMITASTDAEGRYESIVPALAEAAVFIVSFANGAGAVEQITVPEIMSYDRVALQWKGGIGLDLHAREFGADYYTDGHVWRDASGSTERAELGAGGFLTELGDAAAPDSLRAQVYSFPTAASVRGGMVSLSVETEITAENCGKDVEAQTLQLRNVGVVDVQDLAIAIPECDAQGDFVVLEQFLEDVVVARR